MSANEAAAKLLGAVYADPSNDDLRRVYADLLLDAGDPRGEMIHLQLKETLDDEAKARLDRLLERHSDRWLGSLRGWITDVLYERGFPARAKLTALALAEDCDAEDEGWSTIEELTLPFRNVDTDPFLLRMERLITSPVMRSLRTLRDVSVDLVEMLASSDRLSIARLHLRGINALHGHEEACDRLIRAFECGFPDLAVVELGGAWPSDQTERLRRALASRAEVIG